MKHRQPEFPILPRNWRRSTRIAARFYAAGRSIRREPRNLCPFRLRRMRHAWVIEVTWRGAVYVWAIDDGIRRV